MINEDTTVTLKRRPARHKTRTRIRKKPKYLSLRLELSPEKTKMSSTSAVSSDHHLPHHHKLNLFPLHPENPVEEKDTHEENMACRLFSAADCGATTLTALLGSGASSSDDENNLLAAVPGGTTRFTGLIAAGTSTCYEENSLSPPSYGVEEGGELERTAMRRRRESDGSEEKWVCYSEVVERKDEEVSSCVGRGVRCKVETQSGSLALKLDYEEIMNAWSDEGPLYIHMDSPQTVPDLHDDDFIFSAICNTQGWDSSNGGLWRVPEMDSSINGKSIKEEAACGEDWKMIGTGQREARVQRYKEKRRTRLFSKTIRYQVRKLNAEKRPRVKGRFVKRS